MGKGEFIDERRAGELRQIVGLGSEGPPAERVLTAVNVYIDQFDRWYGKQWDGIVPKYHERIIRRINPFVRRAQHGNCDASTLAKALVADWDSRNFVTAGGQALEALAIAAGPHCHKGTAEGVDLERHDPNNVKVRHLYVVKSGAVTRNTDIVSKMKLNLRKAERLLKQNPQTGEARLNYATCVGTLGSTFEDGIHRPSSARFWSEILELDEDQAIKLVWVMVLEASQHVRIPRQHRAALEAAVSAYIACEDSSGLVDWEFLVRVVTQPSKSYLVDHQRRDRLARDHARAVLNQET